MQASKETGVKRVLPAHEGRGDGQSRLSPVLSPDADENKGRSEAEESYVRVKRSDLEKVLAIVERLERRMG